ncbi:M15 family metallopeptidase [Alkalimonas collagenimarina]|uniref:D-alanyl-D-alanine dipeptidase n=1 Tax=Alkalimonas collagenimarina TaxID=400390 RepID=A0ABT9H3G2_9GAMM|nr:M15 family metallopeptidase [Alkalimonas collagenimarina]MDP4537836.1 M15 family metallopeptidase [Alkalimonas collagenimarina]
MKQTILLLAIALACLGCSEPESATEQATTIDPQQKPADFYDMASLIPEAEFHIAYFGPHNFVGSKVDGYDANTCYLQADAAYALQRVWQQVWQQGYNLRIFDCYRPQRAVDHFVRWSEDLSDTRTKEDFYPNLGKDELVGDYIAAQSGHSRGSTVDLTLVQRLADGNSQPLDMGGAFDLFDPISNVDDPRVTAEQRANRQLLIDLMAAEGFSVYSMEWWHFTHFPPAYPDTYFDFPIR